MLNGEQSQTLRIIIVLEILEILILNKNFNYEKNYILKRSSEPITLLLINNSGFGPMLNAGWVPFNELSVMITAIISF